MSALLLAGAHEKSVGYFFSWAPAIRHYWMYYLNSLVQILSADRAHYILLECN